MDRWMDYPSAVNYNRLRNLKALCYKYLIIQFAMSEQARFRRNLALVAELMDEFVRSDNQALTQENQYRVMESDHFFDRMVAALRRAEAAENRLAHCQATVLRLRSERDAFIERVGLLESWLMNKLETAEDFEALFTGRPPPPLSDAEDDDEMTIIDSD